jgi:glycosyltransferase involved in cell wall biosynthesis
MLASDPYGWLPFERAYLRQVLKAWQPQLIHLHNIHGGKGTIPLSMLPEMASFAPIIWTLHDMWLSTGHCAYSLKCERWREGCGSCPDLSLYPELLRDRTKQIAKNKRSILTQANPLLVTPSHWLGNIANDAFATKDLEIEVVANGVDLALFSPAGRDASRRALGIDPNTPVLMFAAQSLAGDIRKGARELRVALENLQARRDCRPLDIILMGESGESLFEGIPGLIIHRAGFISAPTEAAKFYAAADIFICPSLQDNLQKTLIEAAACGTAAITFDSGGCREVVEDGVSGFVLPLGDTDSLSKAISSLIEDPDRLERMGNAARTRAELLFSDTRMASGYYSLYQKLIKRRGG